MIWTPWINLVTGSADLGQRYGHPTESMRAGADIVIVGGGIHRSADPVEAARAYARILGRAVGSRLMNHEGESRPVLDWVVFLMVSGGVGWLLFQRARQAYLLDGRIQTMDVDLLEASGLEWNGSSMRLRVGPSSLGRSSPFLHSSPFQPSFIPRVPLEMRRESLDRNHHTGRRGESPAGWFSSSPLPHLPHCSQMRQRIQRCPAL